MSRVYEFQQDWEIKLYVITQSQSKLKSGSEGTCYLGKDDKVYKIVEADNAVGYEIKANPIANFDKVTLTYKEDEAGAKWLANSK